MKTDGDIFTLVKTVLLAGLVDTPQADAGVRQTYQRRVVGKPTAPTLFVSLMPSQRIGFLSRSDVWDATHAVMTHTETQSMEVTLQVSALVPVAPPKASLPPYTAGDLARRGAQVLQSDVGRITLRAGGLGVERITQIRNPYFGDDTDQQEASPSFDVTFSYNDTDVSQSPIISKVEPGIYPI